MKNKHIKLFIPGPTEIREEIRKEMASPLIGHRSKEISLLLEEISSKVQKLLFTKNTIFVFTSSSTGFMEAAIRNCVKKKVLHLSCGAFGERWEEIAKRNGKEVESLRVPWGEAILPEMVEEKLKKGDFDAVALIHNETSTGVTNPLEEIAKVIKKYPEICFLVDAVSSMGGIKIEVDKLGIDVIFAGSQKCLALPPGIAIGAVSEKALKKAEIVENRGYYFDFLEHFKYWKEKKQTPATPSISHLFALNKKLSEILFEEGLENRFKRHQEMAKIVQDWARERFALFANEKYLSPTLTVISNTREIDIEKLRKNLREKGKEIAPGYGKLKGKCFRIAHMGDLQPEEIKELLSEIDQFLKIK
ncbi:MAG: alanine--glyoxylate aminotransferase family protein [Patescibacteria group bacterium]|nr:alanine--glyoxylate aminotransferase family protein [Patescibacteria group bacterium]